MANTKLKRHEQVNPTHRAGLKALHALFDKLKRGAHTEAPGKVSLHRKDRMKFRAAFVEARKEQAKTHVARCPKCSRWFASTDVRNACRRIHTVPVPAHEAVIDAVAA